MLDLIDQAEQKRTRRVGNRRHKSYKTTVRQMREARDMTVAELQRQLSVMDEDAIVPRQTVENWESGDGITKITITHALLLMRFFGCGFEDLFEQVDD